MASSLAQICSTVKPSGMVTRTVSSAALSDAGADEAGEDGVEADGVSETESPDGALPAAEEPSVTAETASDAEEISGTEDVSGTVEAGTAQDVYKRQAKYGIREAWEGVHVSGTQDAAYYYSSYHIKEDAPASHGRPKIMILGGGPNRIGQGIEFDYCCVHAAIALKELGFETIIVNCNPETVSTDYDTSDKLYFEPVSYTHLWCSRITPSTPPCRCARILNSA